MCTHDISFSIKIKLILSLQLFEFSKGLKNVETAVVNEPPVFEPLKFYCNYLPLIEKSSPRSIQGGNVPDIPYSVFFRCLLFADIHTINENVKTMKNESD